MKKILIIGILGAVIIASIGLVTAGNVFGAGDATGENNTIRNEYCNCINNGQCNCIYAGQGNCICDGQCNIQQSCNQYMNGNCLKNSNSNSCCKIN